MTFSDSEVRLIGPRLRLILGDMNVRRDYFLTGCHRVDAVIVGLQILPLLLRHRCKKLKLQDSSLARWVPW